MKVDDYNDDDDDSDDNDHVLMMMVLEINVEIQSKLAQAVMLLTCVWKVPGSNLSWDVNYCG
jgi:hypothetical protein